MSIQMICGCMFYTIIGYIILPHNHKLRSKHIERFKKMSNVDIKMEDNQYDETKYNSDDSNLQKCSSGTIKIF